MTRQQVRDALDGRPIFDLREQLGVLHDRLAASEARFRGAVDRSTDGVLVVDHSGTIRFANEGAAAMLGRSRDDLVGAEVGFAVLAGDVTEVELVGPHRQIVFAEMRVVDTEWEGVACLLALFRDTTDRHRLEAQLAQRATHDHLTGLPNRFLLEDRVAHALDRLGRGAGPLALFYADLDGFKSINDQLGHAGGDEVLIEAAHRLRKLLRPADSVARVGGDEFVLLCEEMDATAATELTHRIVSAFREPITVSGCACTVSVSIGFVLTHEPGASAADLLAAADDAMYRQKREGAPTHGPPPEAADVLGPSRETAGTPGVGSGPEYRFTLYIAGDSSRSRSAAKGARTLCEERFLPGAYEITVVDVLQDMDEAAEAHIMVTPVLARTHPPPVVRVLGDLSATTKVADALGLPPTLST